MFGNVLMFNVRQTNKRHWGDKNNIDYEHKLKILWKIISFIIRSWNDICKYVIRWNSTFTKYKNGDIVFAFTL